MATNAPCQKAAHCDKSVAAFCRILTILRLRRSTLAEWLRGWCLRAKLNFRDSEIHQESRLTERTAGVFAIRELVVDASRTTRGQGKLMAVDCARTVPGRGLTVDCSWN